MFNIITYILVGILLVGVFGFLIIEIVKLNAKLITTGEYDQKLQVEIPKIKEKKHKKTRIAKGIISILSLVVMVGLLVFSIILSVQDNKPVKGATLKVVYSDSMSYKHENNKYLTTNQLNNQFKKFDIVVIDKLPQEEDLQLYDIVVYEIKETLVIHRIVSIQEREVDGKIEKRYILKGDANKDNDTKSVTYDQMRGIYTGKKISFVGVFVVFMQSPAGWICFAVIALYIFADEYMHKKLFKSALNRYKAVYGEIDLEDKKSQEKQTKESKTPSETETLTQTSKTTRKTTKVKDKEESVVDADNVDKTNQ